MFPEYLGTRALRIDLSQQDEHKEIVTVFNNLWRFKLHSKKIIPFLYKFVHLGGIKLGWDGVGLLSQRFQRIFLFRCS